PVERRLGGGAVALTLFLSYFLNGRVNCNVCYFGKIASPLFFSRLHSYYQSSKRLTRVICSRMFQFIWRAAKLLKNKSQFICEKASLPFNFKPLKQIKKESSSVCNSIRP